MRISGGAARGVSLTVPKGDRVRPATDGLRQAVFSSLAAFVPEARFLDLFAGSGAYGLEALSRGASGGVFVERDLKAVACIKKNIDAVCRSLGRDQQGIRIIQGDVLTWPLDAVDFVPDVVFADPPYEAIPEVAPKVFDRLAGLANRSQLLVVFEMPGEAELAPSGWTPVKRLGGGARQPSAVFFRASQASP